MLLASEPRAAAQNSVGRLEALGGPHAPARRPQRRHQGDGSYRALRNSLLAHNHGSSGGGRSGGDRPGGGVSPSPPLTPPPPPHPTNPTKDAGSLQLARTLRDLHLLYHTNSAHAPAPHA
jgi:hypothetical protein